MLFRSLRNFSDTANTTSPLCKVTVVEKESIPVHRVTFMDDDGTTVIGTVNVTDGGNVSFNTVPVKDQVGNLKYTFSGWSPEGSLSNVTEDRTVYATYTETVIPTPPGPDTDDPGEDSGPADTGNSDGNNTNVKILLPIAGAIILIAVALLYVRRR